MSEEAILHALNTIKEANSAAHEDLREFIRGGISGIHAEMAANAEVTNNNIKTLTDRQEKQNSNVAKLQDVSIERAQVVADFRRLEAQLRCYKKKWLYFLVGGVAFVLVIVIMYDVVGLKGMIDLIK
jgi:hypothetical protein